MPKRFSLSSALLILGVLLFLLLLLKHSQPPTTGERDRRGQENRQSRSPRRDRDEGRRGREPGCDALSLVCESQYLASWQAPENVDCRVRSSHGYPVPDPRCTPGGVNPSVTEEVLRSPEWRTRCLRNCGTSEAEKHVTYGWYRIHKPKGNSGEDQVCELDHLVPLELGGADGLGNIWPECGPDGVGLESRDFKIKDRVETYLADEVRAGRMPLATAQRGIAEDWTQFLPAATRGCVDAGHC